MYYKSQLFRNVSVHFAFNFPVADLEGASRGNCPLHDINSARCPLFWEKCFPTLEPKKLFFNSIDQNVGQKHKRSHFLSRRVNEFSQSGVQKFRVPTARLLSIEFWAPSLQPAPSSTSGRIHPNVLQEFFQA